MKLEPAVLGTVVIFLLMVAISAFIFKPDIEGAKLIFKEEPLEKNTEFQLKPGELYVYTYAINDTQVNMTYAILEGGNCTRIRLLESVNVSETCVDKNGMDNFGYNSAFANPAILLFRPWMLALEEGWHWNSSMYVYYGGMEEHVSDTYYRVVRKDTLDGREVFIVEIRMDDAPPEYQWIDAEKRVLLKIKGDNYEINLAE
ncbi:MAG: hypothetical protein PHF60_01740 [Candidatus ainarchaeum sp.]|nr:hypothetical protein [Candidatus ainarchaeum sp.]